MVFELSAAGHKQHLEYYHAHLPVYRQCRVGVHGNVGQAATTWSKFETKNMQAACWVRGDTLSYKDQ